MVVKTTTSLGISLVCCILLFSGLQMYKGLLSSTRFMTLIAGYTSSWLFIFLLTAVNNLETITFGKGFQAKLIPEVTTCLVLACIAAAMVHRVSVTVCILCSVVGLYYINRQSQSFYSGSSYSHSRKKKS